MDVWQKIFSNVWCMPGNCMVKAASWERGVARKSVGHQLAAALGYFDYRVEQRSASGVSDHLQPYPTNCNPTDLGGNQNQRLPGSSATSLARPNAADKRLIHFDLATQFAASR